MWDNRCAIHLASGGYEGHRRLMYRSTLAGERPLRA
jgi:taurine dioxygenase